MKNGNAYEEDITEGQWKSAGGKVVSVPDTSSTEELNKLISEMQLLSDKANKLAKDKGIDFECVVLDTEAELIEWNSSRC